MNRTKIYVKLLWPHVVISLLLVAEITVSIVSLLSIGKQITALYERAYIISNSANIMNSTFEEIQKSNFRVLCNDSEEICNGEAANIKDSELIIQEQIALIKQKHLVDTAVISKLEKYLPELAPMQERVLYLAAQNKKLEAAHYMETNIIPVIKDAQNELARIIQAANVKDTELMAALRQTQKNTMILLISFGIAGMLFSIVVAIYIRQSLNNTNKSCYCFSTDNG